MVVPLAQLARVIPLDALLDLMVRGVGGIYSSCPFNFAHWAISAHIRKLRPESGLGLSHFQEKVFGLEAKIIKLLRKISPKTCKLFPVRSGEGREYLEHGEELALPQLLLNLVQLPLELYPLS